MWKYISVNIEEYQLFYQSISVVMQKIISGNIKVYQF